VSEPVDERLDARVRALATAAEVADRFVPGNLSAEIAALADRAGQRQSHGLDVTVVAIAGSTGSGKSSLFNALTGLELAATGARRPTTLTTSACVFGDVDATGLLDWLGVAPNRRTAHRSLLDDRSDVAPGLVLLDLPDHDSLVDEHHDEVDRLVDVVDVLVWVTDPVKYADAALHRGYLERLRRHDSVVTVVLNQVDRLSGDDVDRCLVDLRRLVERDGLAPSRVIASSATTRQGLDALGRHLVDVAGARRSAVERLNADASILAGQLSAALGLDADHAENLSVDPRRLDSEVVEALDLGARERDAAERRLAQAHQGLRWPVTLRGGRESSTVPTVAAAQTPDRDVTRLRAVLDDHGQRVDEALPAPWRDEIRASRHGDDLLGHCMEQAARLDRLAHQPDPAEWARHRRAEWLVLALMMLSAVVAVVLGILALTTASVPGAMWAVPVAGVGVAGTGVVLLNGRARAWQQEWSVVSVAEERTAVEADLRDRLRTHLLDPWAHASQEVAEASAALDRAGR